MKQSEIFLRRQKVWELCIQGYTQEQIANKLSVSVRTVAGDLAALKNGAKDWINRMPTGQLQLHHKSNFDAIEKVKYELWNLYENATNENIKLKILNMIQNLSKSSSEILVGHLLIKQLEWVQTDVGEKNLSEAFTKLWRIHEKIGEMVTFKKNCTCGAAYGNKTSNHFLPNNLSMGNQSIPK